MKIPNKLQCVLRVIVALFAFPIAFLIMCLVDILFFSVKNFLVEIKERWNDEWWEMKKHFNRFVKHLKEEWNK